MGTALAKSVSPNVKEDPTFDPSLGFASERKQRVMIAKEEDLKSAKIPMEFRDYCAHLLLDYQACRADNFPLVYKCHHDKHVYLHCEYEDYVIRMKEYERERRLLERQAKKASSSHKDELQE